MGIYDRALAKTDPRIAEIARARLEPGEEIQVSVSASNPIDRADVETAELKPRILSDLLTITSRPFTEKLQVGGPYRPRAAELVRRLTGAQEDSAPTT